MHENETLAEALARDMTSRPIGMPIFTAIKVLEMAKELQADLKRKEQEMENEKTWIDLVCNINTSLRDGLQVAADIIGPLGIIGEEWKTPDCKAIDLDQRLSDAFTNANMLTSQVRKLAEKFGPLEEEGENVGA